MGSPSAILQNPANIWQYPRLTLTVNTRKQNNNDLGSKYFNIFSGFRHKQWSFSLGVISYGIDNIEQYDNEASFVNHFDFSNYAIPIGVSWRTSRVLWGIGTNLIRQDFTKLGYGNESFVGFDVGVSVIDFFPKYDKLNITMSYVNKMIYSRDKKSLVNTALGNSVFGFKVGAWDLLAFHMDIVINSGTDIKNMRLGGQAYWSGKNVKLALNAGYNKVPIGSPNEINYSEYSKYSGKKSLGGFIEFPIPRANNASVQFAYSFEYHPIFDNTQYISISYKI